MQANVQYLKYKPKLKKHCILQAAASGLSLLAIIFLLFLPQFTCGEGLNYTFSAYDEIRLAFDMFLNAGDSTQAALTASTSGILQILGVIFLAAGAIASIVTLIKNIVNIVSPDSYALDMYDKIKRRAEEPKRRRRSFSSTYFVVVGIVYEVFAILLSVFMNNVTGTNIVASYFAYITGVSGAIAVTLIFLVALVVMFIWAAKVKRDIRISILREDYNLSAPTPAAEKNFASAADYGANQGGRNNPGGDNTYGDPFNM